MLWIVKDKEIIGTTDNPNLDWDGYEVKEGADRPQHELYVDEDGAIAIKPQEQEPEPPIEVIGGAIAGEDWQGLENDLRESAAWAQVYEAAGRTIKANRDFTFLYGTLTRTHNISDLKLAIAAIRESMRSISGIGDFSPEILGWIGDRLEVNGFDPSEFDLEVVP